MENNEVMMYQISKEQEKVNKINLNRRERIGATYGNGFMRTIAILFTIFVSLDFFLSFVSFVGNEYNISVILSSLYWIFIMIVRVIPNICTCIALWVIFAKGHNAREVSIFGFRIIQIVLIFQAFISLVLMLIGCIYILSKQYIIPMDGLSETGTYILMLTSIILVQLVKIVIYVFLSVSIFGICKDKKGIKKITFGYVSSIMCIISGGLIILNLIPSMNIISESVISLQLNLNNVYPLIETIIENPINMIFFGLFLGFGGLVGLQYCRKQNRIDEVVNSDL